MRELSEAEIECVSGGEGAAPRDNPGDVIVVTARRKPDGGISPIDWFNTPGSHRNSAMNAAWATATPNQRVEAMGYDAYASIDDDCQDSQSEGSSPEDEYPQARETNCVATTFADSTVSVSRVNNAALAAANDIRGRNQNLEWGAFIYELNGIVYHSEVFGGTSRREVVFNTSILPQGAHVLGVIHNHPDDPNVDDRAPSDHDWDDVYANLAGRSNSRISIDSNMLMYIHTNEDGFTRVYDNTDGTSRIRRERASCRLEN